jgi:mannose-6-phosphate isomerase
MPERLPPLYPLRFKEIYKDKIWGGPELAKIMGKKGASKKTGESWEIAQREKSVSTVVNGPYKGWGLDQLLETYRKEILGDEHSMRFKRYPLLVKFLCCHDKLSLQVHPTDDYAQRYEAEGVGKMEAWYILHAPKDSRVIRGVLPGTTVAEFKQHLAAGTIEQCLNVMDVKEQDVIFIPPGTIHSAYGGVVFLEVQQNSDTTYRLSDWGRVGPDKKPRTLHIEKAMNVTDFYSMGVSKYKPARIPGYPYRRKLLIKCEKFTMETIEMNRQSVNEKPHPQRFVVHTAVAGSGKYFFGEKKKESVSWKKGDTHLIPAKLGEYEIQSNGASEIVVSYVE